MPWASITFVMDAVGLLATAPSPSACVEVTVSPHATRSSEAG
jgi:hypothetical protein